MQPIQGGWGISCPLPSHMPLIATYFCVPFLYPSERLDKNGFRSKELNPIDKCCKKLNIWIGVYYWQIVRADVFQVKLNFTLIWSFLLNLVVETSISARRFLIYFWNYHRGQIYKITKHKKYPPLSLCMSPLENCKELWNGLYIFSLPTRIQVSQTLKVKCKCWLIE